MPQVIINVSDSNEGTAAPYWLIIDPAQMMKPSYSAVAGMITGPFFSRESATSYMAVRPHAFSNRAVVYCHSGHANREYVRACREAGIGC